MTGTGYAHPWFARVYGLLMRVAGPTLAPHRARALTGASGLLLVVGAGRGDDLDVLPPEVTSVLALEPDPTMRAALTARARTVAVPVTVVSGSATALPVAAGSVDAVLCSLVLCSIDDPAVALVEIARVLRPGGTLHLLEHVVATPGSRRRWFQQALDPLWGRVAGGCSLTRDTRRAVAAAGFDVADLEDLPVRPGLPVCVPHLLGTARVTGAAPRG